MNNNALKTRNSDELVGKIIDVRQDGFWYRTKITKYNNSSGEVTVDSTGLDNWPFNYNTLIIDELKTDELKAIKIRDSNSLSFSRLNNNAGKTVYMNGIPHKLTKSLGRNKYQTNRGKINLKTMLKRGLLNDCPFNGTVAKRYASAVRRESNALGYGVT